MNDIQTIFNTLAPVGSAMWDAAVFGLSSSKAAYLAGGFGLGLFLRTNWQTLTAGDGFKAVIAAISLFVVMSLIVGFIAGGV